MTVELLDMDVPYTISTGVSNNATDFIRISANKAPYEYTICLTEGEIDELILTLRFMKNVLKHYKK